jgi:hypothetical protein
MIRRLAALSFLLPAIGHAQIGSPNVFLDESAGPYLLSIFVKSPRAIPGVAEVEIRTRTKDVRAIRLVPTFVAGSASRIAPTPEAMRQSKENPMLFTGSLWLMASGSWKVRVLVDGDRGPGELFVPYPAVSRQIRNMNPALGIPLALLALGLIAGIVSIVGASHREGQLEPGLAPARVQQARARFFMLLFACICGGALFGGNLWWDKEAEQFRRQMYKSPALKLDVDPNGKLFASTAKSGSRQQTPDLVPDQGSFMQLFVVRVPSLEKIYSLHPDMQVGGVFTANLPAMDAGKYQFFGDIIHSDGFPETATAELELKEALRGHPPAGDDSQASAAPAGRNPDPGFSVLSDKYRMIMLRDGKPIRARVASHFTFRVETKSGRPAEDLELLMGVPAQAVFIKYDRSVFARVNPMGSVPMAILGMVASTAARPIADRSTHSMNMGIPAEITFPYGVPSAGDYRIFVQVKRAGKIETGTFDINAIE